MQEKPTTVKQKSLKVEILEKMGQLVTTGFGIVAALAWNDFIQRLFRTFFPRPEDNLWAMLGYAVFITVVIVLVTFQIGRLLERAKNQLNQDKKGGRRPASPPAA